MTSVRDMCDVLVIGAGPAGGMAATMCARAGLRTVLVERYAMPRGKVCGCCLTPTGVGVLEQAGLGHVVDDAATVTRMCLVSTARSARFAMPAYRVISRDVLDMRLVREAQRAGARFVDGTSATVHEDGRVTLQTGDRTWECVAGCVIAADGIAGTSLRELDAFAWDIAESSHMGLGVTLPVAPFAMAAGELTMLVTDDGYVGLVMLPDGAVDVAAAASPQQVREAGGAAAWLQRVLSAHGGNSRCLQHVKVHGTPLLTRRRLCVASGSVLIAGDAAGYVEPFTGEGMTWALRTGMEVSSYAQRMAQAKEHEWVSIAKAWSAHWQTLVQPRHAACLRVARSLRLPWLREAAIMLASLMPAAGREVARRVLGQHEVAA